MTKYLLIALLFASCGSQNNDTPAASNADSAAATANAVDSAANIPIENIVIKTGFHEQIDLDKETFTVYFRNLTSKEYKFTLTDSDKVAIANMARECELASLKDSIHVDDKCTFFPKVMTRFSYTAGGNQVKVVIDEYCDKHPFFKRSLPENIQTFLTFVHKMIRVKPEVAKAAKTDISYM